MTSFVKQFSNRLQVTKCIDCYRETYLVVQQAIQNSATNIK